MATTGSFDVPTLSSRLDEIRALSSSEIHFLFSQVIPSTLVPMDYLRILNPKDLTTSYRVTLLAWVATAGTEVPREMQLRAFLATHNGHDSLVNAGTGSGKTLPIALNLLLDNPADAFISLTISPLKHLQITQESYSNF